MPRLMCLVGPPGTGKTTAATQLSRFWIEAGVPSQNIAYLAFTKAAAKEAAIRIAKAEEVFSNDMMKERFPLFRTIHSLAYMGFRSERPNVGIMDQMEMRAFSKETGYEGRFNPQWEDITDYYHRSQDNGATHWDLALTAFMLSRVLAQTPEESAATRKKIADNVFSGFVELPVYQTFVSRYEDFKRRNNLIDFTDMLEYAVERMRPLHNVRKVIVDEAQDLAPIHHAIIDRLFPDAEEIWFAGDEDQCIYGFSGAMASLFMQRYRTASRRIILRQTHRFGEKLVEFSSRIISRVRDRIAKNVVGMPNRKGVISFSGRFEPPVGNAFVLHRHVQGCQAIAKKFIETGMPFRNERGVDPLGATQKVEAWKALDELADDKPTSVPGMRYLIVELMPSFRVNRSGKRERLVVHGGKKKAEAMKIASHEVSLDKLVELKILTDVGRECIRNRDYRSFKRTSDLEYYSRVKDNGYDVQSDSVPVITTIHGSKGRQAEAVTVFSEMSKKCLDDRDGETRLAYVAATRSRGNLSICEDDTLDWQQVDHYDYPEAEPAVETGAIDGP